MWLELWSITVVLLELVVQMHIVGIISVSRLEPLQKMGVSVVTRPTPAQPLVLAAATKAESKPQLWLLIGLSSALSRTRPGRES